MTFEQFYRELKLKILKYTQDIEELEFACPEKERLGEISESLKTPEELLEILQMIIDSNLELTQVLEYSPASIYVADGEGLTLRINKAFENITNSNRHDMLGRKVSQLEKSGVFRPSVCSLIIKEKRPVAVLQQVNHIAGIFVTGVPIFNEKGELFRTVTNALRTEDIHNVTSYIKQTREDSSHGKREEERIIAQSDSMKRILHLADMIKDTGTGILITGETGVGKGVLAKYIHETGNRCGKRLVEINCGAIPDALLESELFGYESGAFTGADKKGKQGLIEISNGGTLFLDEISELPLLLQVKILHFLQNKTIKRVGGTDEIRVDARVIAASNRTLAVQVEKGLFRSDLYYRLNVVPIHIPPLRERREDIQPTAMYFLNKYMKKYGKTIYPEANFFTDIMTSSWEGNTRELENYVERIVVMGGSLSQIPQFPPYTFANSRKQEDAESVETFKTLKDAEEEMVLKAYEKNRSSYKVAEELGISQTSAYRKIKKYIKK